MMNEICFVGDFDRENDYDGCVENESDVEMIELESENFGDENCFVNDGFGYEMKQIRSCVSQLKENAKKN